MTKVLLIAASLGLCASAANACDFQRSAAMAETTVVASISTPDEGATVPQTMVPADDKEQASLPQ